METASLSRADIEEAVVDSPESARVVRTAALKIATQRAVLLISAAIATRKPNTESHGKTVSPISEAIHGSGPVNELLKRLNEDNGDLRDLQPIESDVLASKEDVQEYTRHTESEDDLHQLEAHSESIAALSKQIGKQQEMLERSEAKSNSHSESIAALSRQIGKQQEMLEEIAAFFRSNHVRMMP